VPRLLADLISSSRLLLVTGREADSCWIPEGQERLGPDPGMVGQGMLQLIKHLLEEAEERPKQHTEPMADLP
jgi:hypothetical protein